MHLHLIHFLKSTPRSVCANIHHDTEQRRHCTLHHLDLWIGNDMSDREKGREQEEPWLVPMQDGDVVKESNLIRPGQRLQFVLPHCYSR